MRMIVPEGEGSVRTKAQRSGAEVSQDRGWRFQVVRLPDCMPQEPNITPSPRNRDRAPEAKTQDPNPTVR
jgi:hypothetical protein